MAANPNKSVCIAVSFIPTVKLQSNLNQIWQLLSFRRTKLFNREECDTHSTEYKVDFLFPGIQFWHTINLFPKQQIAIKGDRQEMAGGVHAQRATS